MSAVNVDCLYFVDDASDEFLISSHLLRKSQFDIQLQTYTTYADFLGATSKLEPLELLRSILILDLNLAVSSGIEGIREMRTRPLFEKAIVGICSGSDDPADRSDAESAGASFFVKKPLGGPAIQRICDAVPELDLLETQAEGRRIVRTTP